MTERPVGVERVRAVQADIPAQRAGQSQEKQGSSWRKSIAETGQKVNRDARHMEKLKTESQPRGFAAKKHWDNVR
ncbi:MAG: hypothetical protein WCK89_23575 [bacterium]